MRITVTPRNHQQDVIESQNEKKKKRKEREKNAAGGNDHILDKFYFLYLFIMFPVI